MNKTIFDEYEIEIKSIGLDQFNVPDYYEIRIKDGKLLGSIKFQSGTINKVGLNGCWESSLLSILIDRLECNNPKESYAYYETMEIVKKLKETLMSFRHRQYKLKSKTYSVKDKIRDIVNILTHVINRTK